VGVEPTCLSLELEKIILKKQRIFIKENSEQFMNLEFMELKQKTY
jgi:hypothetical protein